jgi:hypothetical protein
VIVTTSTRHGNGMDRGAGRAFDHHA